MTIAIVVPSIPSTEPPKELLGCNSPGLPRRPEVPDEPHTEATSRGRRGREWFDRPGRLRCGIEDAGLRNQFVLDGVHGKSEDLQGRDPYEVPVAQDHGDPEALPLNLEEGEADRELDRASDDREPGASLGRNAQMVRDSSLDHGVGCACVDEDPLEFQGAPRAMNAHPCVDLAHVRGHRVCRYERTGYMHVTVGS